MQNEWLNILSIHSGKDLTGMSEQAVREMLISNPELMELYSNIASIDSLKKSDALSAVSSDEITGAETVLDELFAVAQPEVIEEEFPDGEDGDDATDDAFFENSVRNEAPFDSLQSETDDDDSDLSSERNDMRESIEELFGPHASTLDAPTHIGHADVNALFSSAVVQGANDTCAVKCQELVLEDFGIEVESGELVDIATRNGWYLPGQGTPSEHLDKLMELHGISTQHYENANIFNLVSELAQGHRVIVSVDSGELWADNEVLKAVSSIPEEFYEDGQADHAVIVSGVDVSDPDCPKVIITDPATGEVAASYELDDFINAWEDSGFEMVATQAAPPSFPVDHVAQIGELTYEQFDAFYDRILEMEPDDPALDGLYDIFNAWVIEPEPCDWTALPGVQLEFCGNAIPDTIPINLLPHDMPQLTDAEQPLNPLDDPDHDVDDSII